MGGGLAGLCLANQLLADDPKLELLVVEKKTFPVPEAAHKVGESSVEVASHYFRNILGVSDLLAEELPKFGLRFFMTAGDNSDITRRVECGPSRFLTVPSYQIDRGQFENNLAERARLAGAVIVDGSHVETLGVGRNGGNHHLGIQTGAGREDITCRWLIDASGRNALLKKELGLAQPNRHNVNAAWFRLDHPIEPNDWTDNLAWRSRLQHQRRLSTNHLMGPGYWVWLIPLQDNRTSIGIVTDDRLHAFSQFRTFDTAMRWLQQHEPQCAEAIGAHADKRMDYLALRNYSHDAKQVFSRDRWCVTGDSGIFIDPLYSPGSDFIGMSNCYIADLIRCDRANQEIGNLAEAYDKTYRSLARTYLITYQRQYPVMGNARAMSTKVAWDFAMYWGGVAMLYFRDKLCDLEFMDRVRPLLQSFAYTNLSVQSLLRRWAAEPHDPEPPFGALVDYAGVEFLAELNRQLEEELDDEALYRRLESNLTLARALKLEICAEVARTCPVLVDNDADFVRPVTGHLDGLYEALGRTREESCATRKTPGVTRSDSADPMRPISIKVPAS